MIDRYGFIARQSREWAALIGHPLKGDVFASDFGARGDGVTDDTRALQAAIDATEVGGGRLIIPKGRYIVSSALTITNDSDGGITIEGESSGDYTSDGGTQIESTAASGDIFTIDGLSSPSYITFRNITLVGNSSLDNGVKISRASNWRFEGVVFRDIDKSGANAVYLTHGGGIEFTGVGRFVNCKWVFCDRCVYSDKVDINVVTFDQCDFLASTNGFVNGTITSAVLMRTVNFNDCLFEGNTSTDIYSGGGAIGWNILSSYFEWSGDKTPISLEGSSSSPINNAITIAGNIFSGNVAASTGIVNLGDTDGLTFDKNFGSGTYNSTHYCVFAGVNAIINYDINVVGVPSGNTKPSVASIANIVYPANMVRLQDRGTTVLTVSLGADVALSTTGAYFDGPSIATGPAGTWFASGTITVNDTGAAANIFAKLWDGSTVIASGTVRIDAANFIKPISLSGYISNPVGNIRISAQDSTNSSGVILFNHTGNSKDSTLTVYRVFP